MTRNAQACRNLIIATEGEDYHSRCHDIPSRVRIVTGYFIRWEKTVTSVGKNCHMAFYSLGQSVLTLGRYVNKIGDFSSGAWR